MKMYIISSNVFCLKSILSDINIVNIIFLLVSVFPHSFYFQAFCVLGKRSFVDSEQLHFVSLSFLIISVV